ncbi:ABC transporter permease [Pseudofrankia inefficax]|uniref:Transport permease protein n=1 Tax=Pseudofrankia inefficax (strain DSM 45817 / CECT 9037 / DDB 130130 / EuI1c) TaxID=298654 RepID=E3J1N0_PSEI1|nr:ABC transporter permease [Pseudofrankia inefficax]ADP81698.1 ABC-2 type transporter [Pseudofrankia inefficax]
MNPTAATTTEEKAMTSLTATVPARRHPFWRLARVEALLFARSVGSILWTALLPIAAVVVLGAVPATRHPSASFDGRSWLEVYLPILMMYVFVMASVNFLPEVLAGYREKGILRRLATTPVPPARLLGAQALIYLTLGVAIDVVILVIGIGFGAPAPRQPVGFALSLLLVAAATLGIGLLITALVPNSRAANAAGMLAFFPLIFFAGLWIPRPEMNHVLRTISDYSPLGAGVRAVGGSLDGHWPAASALLVLVGWAAVCGAIAARRFRWQ